MKAQVAIAPATAKWISARVDWDALSGKMHADLVDFLSGKKQLTYSRIGQISRHTKIPLGIWFFEEPPADDPLGAEFRTINGASIKLAGNAKDAVCRMQQKQEWATEYLQYIGANQVPVVGSLSDSMTALEAAGVLRREVGLPEVLVEEHGYSSDPFKFLRDKIDEAGVFVMQSGIVGSNTHQPLSVSDFRAFALVDSYAPLIFINRNDTEHGRLFSLCHELAHVGLGQNDWLTQESLMTHGSNPEAFCNRVAAEILVPAQYFSAKWQRTLGNDEQRIRELSEFFKCSEAVIARRALEAGFISQAQYLQALAFLDRMNAGGRTKTKKPGGNTNVTTRARLSWRFLTSWMRACSMVSQLRWKQRNSWTGRQEATRTLWPE